MVNIYYQNVRGLRTKTVLFKRNIQLLNYDIVLLTETWLLDGVNNEELFSDRYTVWRRDRDYLSVGQSRGGGVLIAIRCDLAVQARPEWHSTAEDIWVSLKIGAKKGSLPFVLHIGCLYLCEQNQGLSFTSQLSNYADKVLSASGDFNLSDISWSSSSNANYLTPSFRSINANHSEVQDLMNLCGLNQFNNIRNHLNGLLDLVFSNGDVQVSHCTEPLTEEDSYHPALMCQINLIDLPPRTTGLNLRTTVIYFVC
ncbi:hypothetical protein ABMA27_002850 [Loxostege sticticalis]|uniref:Endonuclease/exonuclease/phosphatase domain-containing protein n=1 Tax=Loxostege sticticalis TaxID=481309 RepID=A0ABR3HV30_LOXSC